MAVHVKCKTVIADDGRRGIRRDRSQRKCFAKIQMTGWRFIRGIRIVPKPVDRDRYGEFFLLGLPGIYFGQRRRITDLGQSREGIPKLFGRESADRWTPENELFSRLFPKIHGWHLIGARGGNCQEQMAQIVVMVGEILREPIE